MGSRRKTKEELALEVKCRQCSARPGQACRPSRMGSHKKRIEGGSHLPLDDHSEVY